jgi:hypothetical protein
MKILLSENVRLIATPQRPYPSFLRGYYSDPYIYPLDQCGAADILDVASHH